MLQLLQKSRSHSDANQPLHVFGARVFSTSRYKREMEALSLVAHAPENFLMVCQKRMISRGKYISRMMIGVNI